jgi:hypothetical protein
MVIGSGETVFNITLENSRNTRYGLQVLGADSGFVKACEFDGLYHIRLALERPENGYENIYEKNLDITLRLVPPPGRGQPDDFHLPLVYMLGQIEFLHIVPDADSGPVTKLTLVFGTDIPGLSVNDIAIKADGADRGRPHSLEHVFERIYQIGIGAVTANEIAVDVAPAGYAHASKTVATSGNPEETKFAYAGAHDNYGTTTKLTLVFDRDIPDLSAHDIAITGRDGGSAATVRGALLERKAAGVYELAVDVTESKTITVTVEKNGCNIVPASRTVEVRCVVQVQFGRLEADGEAHTAATTRLTLVFDKDIDGLSTDDLTVNTGTAGATAGTLVKAAGTGTYTLDGVAAEAAVSVGVSKRGYAVGGSPKTVTAHYPLRLVSVTADGGVHIAATTQLTLVFDRDIAGLSQDDITVDGLAGPVGKGGVTRTGTGTYTLPVSGIMAAGTATVSVARNGYAGVSAPVAVYGVAGVPVAGAGSTQRIKAKFGIAETETAGVAAAFHELSAFISGGRLMDQPDVNKLGDYIDLEGRLTVEAYNCEGARSYPGTTTQTRLTVAGINSFYGKNGNNTQHVVFHFQNVPVTRRMNATNTNAGGYPASEMREYVTGNFLAGLLSAGVPESVLWGPARVMSKKDGQEILNNHRLKAVGF